MLMYYHICSSGCFAMWQVMLSAGVVVAEVGELSVSV